MFHHVYEYVEPLEILFQNNIKLFLGVLTGQNILLFISKKFRWRCNGDSLLNSLLENIKFSICGICFLPSDSQSEGMLENTAIFDTAVILVNAMMS